MKLMGLSEKQQKILHLLMQDKAGMTVEQFSNLLEISRSAIHQHMAVLERDGYVRKLASTQTGGRPGTVFEITEKGINLFPKHYSLFAEMLIRLIKNKAGSNKLAEYLRELGISLAETRKDDLKNKPLNEQIKMVAMIMQELGYEAQIAESGPEQNPMIDAYNCIFHDLALKNREVCELDLSLLSSLLNRKIEHKCCMAKGDNRCCFIVLPSDEIKADQ